MIDIHQIITSTQFAATIALVASLLIVVLLKPMIVVLLKPKSRK